MKHKFEKKRVIKTVIYLVLGLGLLEGGLLLNGVIHRYYCQAMIIASIVFDVLFLRSLKKTVPESLRKAVGQKVRRGFNFVMKYLRRFSSFLKKVFGIPEIQFLRGKEESSFIFDIENTALFRKLHQMKNTLRWRDLEENADKIRFIYIKYIVKLMRKGFKFRVQYTPYEISDKMKLPDDQATFIEIYNHARYSGGRRPISNTEVEDSMHFAK